MDIRANDYVTAEDYLEKYPGIPFPWRIKIKPFERLRLKVLVEDRFVKNHYSCDDLILLCYLCLKDRDEITNPLMTRLQRHARNGDLRATYLLGKYYEIGLSPFSQDDGKAFYYFKKAENLGVDEAKIHLAKAYLTGKGVDKDIPKAFEIIMDSPDSTMKERLLGYCLFTGCGTKQDISKGLEHLENASRKKDGSAEAFLAESYYQGKLVKEDKKKAFDYFVLASQHGQKRCNYIIGEMLLNGDGIKKDPLTALEYYKRDINNHLCKKKIADISIMLHLPIEKSDIENLYRDAFQKGDYESGIEYAKCLLESSEEETRQAGYAILKKVAKKNHSAYFILYENYHKDKDHKNSHHFLRLAIRSHDLKAISLARESKTLHQYCEKELALGKANGEEKIISFLNTIETKENERKISKEKFKALKASQLT